jgi:hypothetical protein
MSLRLKLFGGLSCLCAAGALACGGDEGDVGLYTADAEEGGGESSSASASATASSGASTATGAHDASTTDAGEESGSTTESTDGGSTGPLLDVGSDTTASGEGGGEDGCAKVDFLFVVDNSGSMSEEQANLATSFPGFINAIQGTLMAQDYHIMVTDTDSVSAGATSLSISNGTVTCEVHPNCCVGICNEIGGTIISPPPATCNGEPCTNFPLPDGCEATLGSGRNYDQLGASCNIANDATYMLDTQPDLVDTFTCAALVGPNGDGLELPMEAMMQAIGEESDAGGCNEGFLRDDAILVVTFITDEDDDGQSIGDPASWKDYLVQAKGGNEDAVVVLGLIADEGFPGGTCTDNGDAPVLRSFAESFNYGTWASVCEPDYTQFFVDAVSDIDTACDGFIPPG